MRQKRSILLSLNILIMAAFGTQNQVWYYVQLLTSTV